MRFKVGDKVRVKDIEGATGNMKDMAGEVVTIKDNDWNSISYQIHEDYGEYDWEWTDEMLEPIVSKTERVQEDPLVTKIEERNNKPVKMISDENLLNENDPIKPSHYKTDAETMQDGQKSLFENARIVNIATGEVFPENDKVNSPSHYTRGDIEVIDIIKQLTQGYEPFEAYLIGNTIKYLARANYKENKRQDLEKAEWHIDKLLKLLEEENAKN